MTNAIPDKSKSKVVILGEQAVGKTSLLSKFVHDDFETAYKATIGIDFIGKTVFLGNSSCVRLQIWDTAGSERFKALIPGFVRNSDYAIIAYDITNLETFSEVEFWVNTARNGDYGDTLGLFLVGCKADLTNHRRQVSVGLAEEKARKLGINHFIETSSKTGQNVKNLFKIIAEDLVDKYEKHHPEHHFTHSNVVLTQTNQETKQNSWCFCL